LKSTRAAGAGRNIENPDKKEGGKTRIARGNSAGRNCSNRRNAQGYLRYVRPGISK